MAVLAPRVDAHGLNSHEWKPAGVWQEVNSHTIETMNCSSQTEPAVTGNCCEAAATQFSHSQIKVSPARVFQLDHLLSNSPAQRTAATWQPRAHSAPVNGRKTYCSTENCPAEIMC